MINNTKAAQLKTEGKTKPNIDPKSKPVDPNAMRGVFGYSWMKQWGLA